jgi:hypothetical protein
MLKWEAGSIRKWEVAVTAPARPADNNSKARKSQANPDAALHVSYFPSDL